MDGRAGRASADDTPSGQNLVKLVLRQRAAIGIHETPLTTTREPETLSAAQRLDEGFPLRLLPAMRVNHGQRGEAETFAGDPDM